MNHFLVKFCLFIYLFVPELLFANDKHLVDSSIGVINHKKYVDEKQKYDLLLIISENSNNADSLIYYSNLAAELAEKLDVNPSKAFLLNGIGWIHKGNLSLALEKFLRSARLYEKEKAFVNLAIVYDCISNTYSSLQNHSNAIYYLKKAIEIIKIENDSIKLASLLHNLGYEYYKIQHYDSALYLFENSRKIYQNLGYELGVAYCIGNSGLVYSKQLDTEKAKASLTESVQILEKYNDQYAITEYMMEFADIYRLEGNINKAIHYALDCYRLSETNNIYEFMRDAAFRLSQLYQQTKQYDSAYLYQSIYIAYADSIKNLESIQKMADLRTEFEVSKKQSEVNLLQKEKTSQWIIIGALVVILILAGGLIIVYYNGLKRARRFTFILEERKKLLEKQSQELQKLNHIKDKFFSILSHDLRSPISSLGGISIMINQCMETHNRALLKEISSYIDQTVYSLSGLLENLLNWAQSQQGQIPYHEENIHLKSLISEIIKIFATISVSKQIKIILNIKENIVIKGDRNSMMIIFRNLLSNAFKYTHKGGYVKVTSVNYDDNKAEIKIADNGIGISSERIPGLFELREDKSTWGTEKEKGFGIGLNLVYEFTKQNKGEIIVESTEGKGTVFTLFFPSAKQLNE